MFKKQLTTILLFLSFILIGTNLTEAQYLTPRPSPLQEVTQKVGISDVTIVYSRPGVKERVIWGELVPYNEMWRTGANANTIFEISHDATIEGNEISAGKYSLFTIPTEKDWTIIINKKNDHSGTSGYDEANDVMRFTVSPAKDAFVERMRFDFENLTDNSADVVLRWEELRVPFKIEFNTEELVLTNIEVLSVEDPNNWQIPYYGAVYVLSNELDYQQGLDWINKSVSIEESYWNLRIKAQLLAATDQKEEAIETMEKAIELGEQMENAPFDFESSKQMLKEWKS